MGRTTGTSSETGMKFISANDAVTLDFLSRYKQFDEREGIDSIFAYDQMARKGLLKIGGETKRRIYQMNKDNEPKRKDPKYVRANIIRMRQEVAREDLEKWILDAYVNKYAA